MKSAALCTLLFVLAFADKDASLLDFKTRPIARPSSWNNIQEDVSLATMSITPVYVPSSGDETRRGTNVSLFPSQEKEMEENSVEKDLSSVRIQAEEDLLVPIVSNSTEVSPSSSSQKEVDDARRKPVYPLLPNIQLKEVDSSVSNKSSVLLNLFLNETEESVPKWRPMNSSSTEAQSTGGDIVSTLTFHPPSWFDIQNEVLLAALNLTTMPLLITKNQSNAEDEVPEVSGPVDFSHEGQDQEDTVERHNVFLSSTGNQDTEDIITPAASINTEFPSNSNRNNEEELVGRRPLHESLIKVQPNLDSAIPTFKRKPELSLFTQERDSTWTPKLQYPPQMKIPPETAVYQNSKKRVLHPSSLNNVEEQASIKHPQFLHLPSNMPLKEEGLPVLEHASEILSLLWKYILQRAATLRSNFRKNVHHYNALQSSQSDNVADGPPFPLARVDFSLAALRKLITPALEFGAVGAVIWLLTFIARKIFLKFKGDDHHKPCH